MSLDEICYFKEAAENQRKMEVERGEGLEGTRHYEEAGCYGCDGLNQDCLSYLSAKSLQKHKAPKQSIDEFLLT